MGAAGLTCSSAEMASKAGNGMELYLDQVPQREEGMTAYEMMLSESQERMLFVVEPEDEAQAIEIFERWGLSVPKVGKVTDDGRLKLFHHGEVVGRYAGNGAWLTNVQCMINLPKYLPITSKVLPSIRIVMTK